MLIGVLAQGLARHLRIPGIVLLLAAGVVFGPDILDLIRPANLGIALPEVVGFAVAVILFEGGLGLNIGHLRKQAKPIRRLVTIGAIVTAVLATITARLAMGWDWRLSVLFGTLVIVTGPTVITPLLRRIKVRHDLEVILEAEGIFIDAVGATIAVVALEAVIVPVADSLYATVHGIAIRVGVGTVLGLVGGVFLALLIRWRKVVPEGLHNILGLATAVALFQISNQIAEESGIVAVIVAGVLVGNARSHALTELKQFGGQLTELLIATLFVLLAADVRIDDIRGLGFGAVITVVVLMFVVRPLSVIVSTYKTDLALAGKGFLAWLGPRGIVAAAVASLFAARLAHVGIEGGTEMRALVFLVIACTVTIQGLSGGVVASFLGVRRAKDNGYLILGANMLGLHIGREIRSAGVDVMFIDSNPTRCQDASEIGATVRGNALDDAILDKLHADTRIGVVGITSREDTNFLFAQRVKANFAGPAIYVGLETTSAGVTGEMVEAAGCNVLFGSESGLTLWNHRLRYGEAMIERWHYEKKEDSPIDIRASKDGLLLPLVVFRKGSPSVMDQRYECKSGDIVSFAIARNADTDWLREAGWERVPDSQVSLTNLSTEAESNGNVDP